MNRQFRAAKQLLEMHRASTQIMLKGLIAIWEQTAIFSEAAAWLPQERRREIGQWAEINRKACEALKSALESGYSNLEKFFPS